MYNYNRHYAVEQVEYFYMKLPKEEIMGNFVFLSHVACLEAFSVDMLYHLWRNFNTFYENDKLRLINRIVVSDLLLSNLCHEVGFDLFEMDEDVRRYLEQFLEEPRRKEIAAFAYQYSEKYFNHPGRKRLQNTYYWKAIAIIDPDFAAKKVVNALNEFNLSKKYSKEERQLMVRIEQIISDLQKAKNTKVEYSRSAVVSSKPEKQSTVSYRLKGKISERISNSLNLVSTFEESNIISDEDTDSNFYKNIKLVASQAHEVEIEGQIVPEDSIEAITQVSSNRILLIQQLTSQQPLKTEPIYGLKNIDEVFAYFRPSINVEFRNIDNDSINDKLKFIDLSDFSKEGLVAQSKFLKESKEQQETYVGIPKQLKHIKILKSALLNPEAKAAFLRTLQILIQELEDIEEISLPLQEPAPSLEEATDQLIKYGGFELIEFSIEGAKFMNPKNRVQKNIFLFESSKQEDRRALKKRLQAWQDLFSEFEDVNHALEEAQKRAESAESQLRGNLKRAMDVSKELERSYRSVAHFYKNTEQDKIKNITIFNANIERLKDLENPMVIDKIDEELKARHDRLDLRENYAMLVIPGYLGSNKVVEKWAKIAHQNKVMLITDFENLDSPDGVMEEFDAANLAGGDIYLSNVMMTCNWVVGRERYDDLGEDEEMFVPPSTALAGKIYSTLIAQPIAGIIRKGLSEIEGVSFALKKSEISEMERRGLIPMVKEWDKVMAFSVKTLYNGSNLGLQTYSVVRVFDYLSKVMIDSLNRQVFVNWTPSVEKDWKKVIESYLNSIKGHDKIIENFFISLFTQDKENKRIVLEIQIRPFFPSKNFLLKLGGTIGYSAEEWVPEYAEQ